MSRAAEILLILSALVLLPIVASPADPTWIEAIFDAADGDDVVALAADAPAVKDRVAYDPFAPACSSEDLVNCQPVKYESPGSFRMARGPPQTPVLGVTRLLPDDILAPPLTARPTAPVQVPAREESALEWLTRESTSEARDQFASNQVADQFTARGQFEGFEFLG